MLDAQGQYIRINYARVSLRQHFTIDAGIDEINLRPIGSDVVVVDNRTRALCQEIISDCRELAHKALTRLIDSAELTVWQETDEGKMSIAAPTWASAAFDGKDGLRADRLYFSTVDWEAILIKLSSSESRRYFFEQRTNSQSPTLPVSGVGKKFSAMSDADLERYSDLDGLGEWCLCFQAAGRLHQRLLDEIGNTDPAPWIEKAEWYNNLDILKWNARTGLTFRRALLAGELTAYFLADEREYKVPGWAWANERAANEAIYAIGIPIDPFLDFDSPTDMRTYLRRNDFETWLQCDDIALIGDLPALPHAYDLASKPAAIDYREPTDTPFVDLTEAVTWAAFNIAMSRDTLMVGEAHRFGPFEAENFAATIDDAVIKLIGHASGGLIRLRGRYIERYFDEGAAGRANTTDLSNNNLRDFGFFEPNYSGLQAGRGYLDKPLRGVPGGNRHDGWRDVEVCRADLLRIFPVNAGGSEHSQSASKAAALKECKTWLKDQFLGDPENKRTKADFMAEAMAHFGVRLSQRGFGRVWDEIASKEGRSKPGRKS